MQNLYGATLLTTVEQSSLLWLPLVLPLLGALTCAFVGGRMQRRWGPGAPGAVAVTMMVSATLAALLLIGRGLWAVPGAGRSVHQALWPMFGVAGVEVTFGLTLDALSAVMLLVVTVVGTLIHLYAAGYMKAEPSLARFFAYLNLFVFSMLLLVLADGFVPLLIGWEGVGVCSYLLIGFWFRRPVATAAATKAFIVNRVGDWGLLTGVCLLLWGLAGASPRGGAAAESGTRVMVQVAEVAEIAGAGGAVGEGVARAGSSPRPRQLRAVRIGPTLDFRSLADQLGLELPPSGASRTGAEKRRRPFAEALSSQSVAGLPLVFVVCLLFFLGAAGKSAQLPLFAWLPDAMAGPTPVSALIHAATMVTAGIYLIARLGFLFALSPGALTVIAVVGALTALVGATAGCLQWDLKRVLAYSTVSQLGFMFVAVGAGAFQAGIFHVVTHAFFKACLFLAAGSVIHAVNHIESGESSDPQDMRNMGGLARALPWTRRGYLLACVAIAGFPLASGFFSKDQILLAVATSQTLRVSPVALFALLGVISALTAFYMFRSYFLVFLARPPRREPTGNTHEPSRRMTAVVLILAAASTVAGAALGWPRNWTGNHAAPLLDRILAPVFAPTAGLVSFHGDSATLEWGVQLASAVLAALGFFCARALYRNSAHSMAWRSRVARRFTRLPAWVAGGWGFDSLYHHLAVLPAGDFARAAAWLDRHLFDAAVNAVGRVGMALARATAAVDRGAVDGAVDGVSDAVLAGGRRVARLQSGHIGGYVLAVGAGVAVLALFAYLLGS